MKCRTSWLPYPSGLFSYFYYCGWRTRSQLSTCTPAATLRGECYYYSNFTGKETKTQESVTKVVWVVSKNGNTRLRNQVAGSRIHTIFHCAVQYLRERSEEEDNRVSKASSKSENALWGSSYIFLLGLAAFITGCLMVSRRWGSGMEMCDPCCSQRSHQSLRMRAQIWFWFINVYFQLLVLMPLHDILNY